jgi:hypothetical protein
MPFHNGAGSGELIDGEKIVEAGKSVFRHKVGSSILF